MRKPVAYLWLLILPLGVYSQKPYKVFNWNGEGTLSTYLTANAHKYYLQRNEVLAKALSSRQGILAYRDQSIRSFKRLIGDRPDTGRLNPVITGVIRRDGYRIEKLIIESFADHHVTANVYIPEGKGPFPAAIIFCGHEAEAKATESYQKTAILFAKNGFVVLMADPISQGERFQLTDSAGTPLTRGGTAEHTLLNVGSNLAGTSIAAYELWDNIRCLDYLGRRPEVDSNRIGCLGNSGGGTQTAYMIGYDQRIKVSALCSYVLNNDPTIEYKGPPDGCVPIPGEIKAGLTDGDYFLMFLPKPVLVLAGRYDFIKYNHVSEVFAETQKAYAVVGEKNKTSMLTIDDGHGISQPKREAAVTWFRKWLCHDSTKITEGNSTTLTVKELNCTTTGQVNSMFPHEMTIQRYNQLRVVGGGKKLTPAEADIKRLTGIHNGHSTLAIENIGSDTKAGYIFQKLILRKEQEVPMPCLVFYPAATKSSGRVVVWAPGQGKNKLADSAGLVQQYLANGDALIIADLRGFGEELERDAINDTKYYNPVYRTSNTALLMNVPLVGERANDIITLVDFIKQDTRLQSLQIDIHASGVPAVSVLHAAAIDKRIDNLHLYTNIQSFHDLLQDPVVTDLYPYVVAGACNVYDLHDLVEMAGKEKVHYHRAAPEQ